MKNGSIVLLSLLLLAVSAGTAAAASDPFDQPWSEVLARSGQTPNGLRCGTLDRAEREMLTGPWEIGAGPADCSANQTIPDPTYASTERYGIQVVFHIIRQNDCTTGHVPEARVHEQIQVLNEDLLAILGSNGQNGTDVQVSFRLATEDPAGNPTTGITYSCNTNWFNDNGSYWNTLAWDPNRYMNVYTNSAGGALGYVPFLPADGGGVFVGGASDRVVLLWDTVGTDAPIGPPFHLGRTGTHEIGHYLGLEHTFNPQGSCGSAAPPGCYTDGDLICDTNPESTPTFGCPGSRTTCSLPAPFDNYMDYSDDICMEKFTAEQAMRIRCTLLHYRTDVWETFLFTDGFESGDTSAWSQTVP